MVGKKIISFFLAILLFISILMSCGNNNDSNSNNNLQSETDNNGENDMLTEKESDILDGLDFAGRPYRIQMSSTTISSHELMQGLDETT